MYFGQNSLYWKCCVRRHFVMKLVQAKNWSSLTYVLLTFQNLKTECLVDWLFWRNKFLTDNSFHMRKRSAWFLNSIFIFTQSSVVETLGFFIQDLGILFLHCNGRSTSLIFTDGQVLPTIMLKVLGTFLFSSLFAHCKDSSVSFWH